MLRMRSFPTEVVLEAADLMHPASASVTELGDTAEWLQRRALGWPLPDYYTPGRDD